MTLALEVLVDVVPELYSRAAQFRWGPRYMEKQAVPGEGSKVATSASATKAHPADSDVDVIERRGPNPCLAWCLRDVERAATTNFTSRGSLKFIQPNPNRRVDLKKSSSQNREQEESLLKWCWSRMSSPEIVIRIHHTHLPFTDVTALARVRRAFEGLAQSPNRPLLVCDRQQRDFLEIVSSSYHPGLIPPTLVPSLPGGFDPAADFLLSISLPTVSLADTVPAQALVAWDRARATCCCSSRTSAARAGSCASRSTCAGSTSTRTRSGAHVHARHQGCTRRAARGERARDDAVGRRCGQRRVRCERGGAVEPEPLEEEDLRRFQRFSLSSSLETLQLLKLCEVERDQKTYRDGWDLHGSLCTRYCIVCYEKLTAEVEALKPHVSATPNHARTGITPSIVARRSSRFLCRHANPDQSEIIHNLQTVDLLMSLTSSAASEGVVDDLFPSAWGSVYRCPTLVASSPRRLRTTQCPLRRPQQRQF
ncbi:hypothetical protein C8J57DRAFT_1481752 [Mycena rebaudengoi]|nr:hypothetical protein C8J57DRAFT_1481752 [Mycena rebaudengoi]